MKITIRSTDPLVARGDCLVVGVFERGFSSSLLQQLDSAVDGLLGKAHRSGEFSGKSGEELLLQPTGQLPAKRLLLIGLGLKGAADAETLRRAAGSALRRIAGGKWTRVTLALPLSEIRHCSIAQRVQATAEGVLLAGYRYDRFLGDKARKALKLPHAVSLLIDHARDRQPAEAALSRAQALCRAVNLARDLVNSPGNVKSPEFLADQARQAAEQSNLVCTILEREALTEQGFGALLGVAQGSVREPRLIELRHNGGSKDEKPVALVGKGVVFDAGGISLKPAEKMDEMKMDMAGGAAVIATLLAASLLDLPLNLVGIVPTVENLPSGTAYRPGDILTSLSGQTIEVLNTDAEGRLILADALTYAKRFEPRLVVDLATLTGACIIALGHHATAVLGNDQKLVQQLLAAGEECGERLWQLPLWEVYDEQIKSAVADVKNSGGRPAGSITAAAFLKKFVGELRWAHLDIAGTAWSGQDHPYTPAGGSGVGVRLLIDFLSNLSAPR
jgi:leucyl aminopeptidase